jgi:hypothetical protein
MPLADKSEPLKLADGTLIYPGGHIVSSSQEPGFVEIPTHREAQRVITATRRKVSDLPEVPKTMNAIGAVLSYSLFGLDDDEIAIATGFTVDQIGRIKVSDPYTQMHEAVVRTVLDSETDVVRELLAKNARSAAIVMVDALQAGARSDRMAAAKDILDRSGHRPADVVEHRHRVDGGLVIEYVKREDRDIPTIDMGAI